MTPIAIAAASPADCGIHVRLLLFSLWYAGQGRSLACRSIGVSRHKGSLGSEMPRMTIHLQPNRTVLLVDEQRLVVWLSTAKAGDVLRYHKGNLTIDRLVHGSRLPDPDRRQLNRVASLLMTLARSRPWLPSPAPAWRWRLQLPVRARPARFQRQSPAFAPSWRTGRDRRDNRQGPWRTSRRVMAILFVARCLGHGRGKGDRQPSLMLRDGDRRLLVHCFAGCDVRDVLAALQHHGLLKPDPEYRGRAGIPSRPASRLPKAEKSAHASSGSPPCPWRERWPSDTSPNIVACTGPFPPSLRFAPACLHPRLRWRYPALVAAVQAADDRITAVQVTWLSETDASKALPQVPRWTFGALGEGAVRLGTAAVLGLAEGVEDALAASQLSQLSCWACLGAARMHRVVVPDNVREVHIFADDDEPGRAAADRTANVHRDRGRRVVVRLPPAGPQGLGRSRHWRAPEVSSMTAAMTQPGRCRRACHGAGADPARTPAALPGDAGGRGLSD